MNSKLLSVLVATGICCIANPISAVAMGNGSKQPYQSIKAAERATTTAEKFEALMEAAPTAAGQPLEETQQIPTGKRHAPSGTWTWKGGATQGHR